MGVVSVKLAGKFALLSGPPDDFRGSAGIFLFGICLAFKRDFIYMPAGLSVPAVLLADIDDWFICRPA